jgi:hypothetical protein
MEVDHEQVQVSSDFHHSTWGSKAEKRGRLDCVICISSLIQWLMYTLQIRFAWPERHVIPTRHESERNTTGEVHSNELSINLGIL